jgi:hypothetical protein
MGREIRRVPPNWQHPKSEEYPDRDQAMYDRRFDDAAAEWREGLRKWEAGEDDAREEYKNDDGTYQEYWEWHGNPPERAYYRPWRDEEATWYQLWQTVSEGTPVSPPFATKEELAEYLAKNGDTWDQDRCKDPRACQTFGLTPGKPGWGKEVAYNFVMGDGWAPSMVISDGKFMSGVEFVATHQKP